MFQEDGFLFDGTRLAEGAALLARLRDDRVLCDNMGERGRIKVRFGQRSTASDLDLRPTPNSLVYTRVAFNCTGCSPRTEVVLSRDYDDRRAGACSFQQFLLGFS